MQLININNQQTMSSLEIVKVINAIRKEEGNTTELRHDHFMDKVPNVIGEINAPKFLGTYKTTQGNEYQCYNFPKRESMLMAMSYSYLVQAKVYDRWQELESKQTPKIPQTYKQALLELVATLEAKQVAMLTRTIKGKEVRLYFIECEKQLRQNQTKQVPSARYDYQNLYHLNSFRACYPAYSYDLNRDVI